MEDKCQDRYQEINILDRSCKIQATKYKMVYIDTKNYLEIHIDPTPAKERDKIQQRKTNDFFVNPENVFF